MSAATTILIADDDRAIRTVLDQALGRLGHTVRTTGNAAMLWQWINEGQGDLVITDVVRPDENGLDLIPRIRKLRPNLRVIVMSAQNTLLTAVKATESGAFEYLPKPFDLHELVATVERALNQPVSPAEAPPPADDALPLIGRSPAMQEIYRVLARLMATDLTVMIHGESGTGKELVARALHDLGKRRKGPFVAINMAAIPRELIEIEKFGREKGAFTGALARSTGRFEQAAGGTLFLDEIGDMPPALQAKLLRFLQERIIERVGGREQIAVDVRVVCATNQDLAALIERKQFRQDLYFRISEVPIQLPALRERAGGANVLAHAFLRRFSVQEGIPKRGFTPDAVAAIQAYAWPGNVRELENKVKTAVIMSDGPLVTAADLALAHAGSVAPAFNLKEVRARAERDAIHEALAIADGNISRAADLLGVSRPTLYDLMDRYGLRRGDEAG
ncbi:MAG: sigma-54-dependent transcriptional regulator [Gammaproteobacteria bacterium]